MRQNAQNEVPKTASLSIELRYKNIYLILLSLHISLLENNVLVKSSKVVVIR